MTANGSTLPSLTEIQNRAMRVADQFLGEAEAADAVEARDMTLTAKNAAQIVLAIEQTIKTRNSITRR